MGYRNPWPGNGVSGVATLQGEQMKTILRRLLILAAPIVWRKIRERRGRR